MLGGFFGFLLETIWCMIRWRKLESRKGLIYGHFIPIYGFAVLFISAVVEVFHIHKWYTIFLVTFLISGVVEYVSSIFQEKLMGTSAWDYSKMKFNLHGRINLVYLLGFSFFGVLWCKGYPVMLDVMNRIIHSDHLDILVTMMVFGFMIYNTIISCLAGSRRKQRRNGVAARNKVELWIDNKYTEEFMRRIYPNSEFIDDKQS